MKDRLIRNLTRALVVLFGISLITFVLSHVIGDPLAVLLPLHAPQEARTLYRHEMGLDRPLGVQYLAIVTDIVRGHFGDSFLVKKPVLDLIAERIPRTLLLTVAGMVVAITVAFPLGILAGYRRRSAVDSASIVLAVAGSAIPIYWLGLMLQILLGVRLHWLPPSGYGSWRHLILPALSPGGFLNVVIVLGVTGWPIYTRVVRSEAIRLRSLEFTVAARAMGLTSGRILLRHILPNLLSAVIVIASLDVARFIIVEAFLSFLGLGVQPPIPSWGGMLGEFRPFMFDRWWLPTFPGTAIFITALAVSLVGDGLRDLLDPYSHGP